MLSLSWISATRPTPAVRSALVIPLFTAFFVALFAAPVRAGGFFILAELPTAETHPKDAALILSVVGCHGRAHLAAKAEGLVDGRRVSTPVRLDPQPDGTFALKRQWPAQGTWLVSLYATSEAMVTWRDPHGNPGRPFHVHDAALVTLGPDGGPPGEVDVKEFTPDGGATRQMVRTRRVMEEGDKALVIDAALRAAAAGKGAQETPAPYRDIARLPKAERDWELDAAAGRGDAARVRALLDAGANVNYTYGDGWTPLMDAALQGHQDVVALLLDRGADLNARLGDGATLLFPVCAKGRGVRTLELLLRRGAEVNARNKAGSTPLIAAAWGGDPEKVKRLLAAGADVNARDTKGRTALAEAMQRKGEPGRAEIIRLLRQAGAKD